MRAATCVYLGLAVGMVWAEGAVAQNVPSSPQTPSPTLAQLSPSNAGGSSVRRAPIGHRQPTQRDVQSAQERTGNPSVPMIYAPASICRDCGVYPDYGKALH